MQTNSTIDSTPIPDRLVWVISLLEVPEGQDPKDYVYKENFRGKLIEVLPERQKKLLMNYLECRRFLGQPVALAEPNPDGSFMNEHTGTIDPTKFGKPLKMIELTLEEKQELDPESLSEKEKAKIEKMLAAKNHSEGSSGDIETVGKGKPQAQRGRRRASTSEATADLAGELDT